MHSDPGARKDRYKTAPYNAPNCPAVREVGTTISRQRGVVDNKDGARADKGTLNQVVDKEGN